MRTLIVVVVLVLMSTHLSAQLNSVDRELAGEDPNDLISGGINSMVKKAKKKPVDEGTDVNDGDSAEDDKPSRSAAGGIINTVLVFLCILAFGGNALFLVHVFYIREKIVPLKLVHHDEQRSHQL